MNKILAFTLGLFLSGCATKFFVPANHFLTPESNGGTFHSEIKNGFAGVTDVTVADDDTKAVPDTTPKLIKNTAAQAGATMGLIPHIDAYANYAMGGPVFVGGKLQILGDNMREAKSGNFSLAVAGGWAVGDETSTQTSNSIEGKSKLMFSGYEGMALVGYRPSDWTLLYGGPFVTRLKAKIETQRTVAGVTTITSQPHGEGEMKGATAGLRFGKWFFVDVEVSWTQMQWKRMNPSELESNKFTDSALGAQIGGMW